MNNRGFTLIELIATIALLSVIAVISFVSINGIITQNKVNECNILVNNIKSAATEYVSDNRYNDVNFSNLTALTLIDSDDAYLSSPIINPITGSEVDAENIKITVTLNSDRTAKSVTVAGIDCGS